MNIAKTSSEIRKQLKKANNYMANNYKLLNNRYLLYFILIIVIVDMFLFVRVGEVFYIFLYILFGLLVSLQTNNMMIILASAMILTNIVKYSLAGRKVEGFGMNLGRDIFEALGPEEQSYFRRMANDEEPPLTGLNSEEQSAVDQILEYLLGEKKKQEKPEDEESKKPEEEKTTPVTKEPEVKDPVKELVGFSSDKKPRNIEGLEADAQKLIKTQEALQANMQSLEPMLKQAESFMNDLKNIKGSSEKK